MKHIRNKQGSALVELVASIAVIGTLVVAVPTNFASYETLAHNVYAQTHLRNLYLACKTYWAANGGANSCSLPIAKQVTDGFVQSANVTVVMGNGRELTFRARARHNFEDTEYTVCANGGIQTTACGS